MWASTVPCSPMPFQQLISIILLSRSSVASFLYSLFLISAIHLYLNVGIHLLISTHKLFAGKHPRQLDVYLTQYSTIQYNTIQYKTIQYTSNRPSPFTPAIYINLAIYLNTLHVFFIISPFLSRFLWIYAYIVHSPYLSIYLSI